MTLGVHRVALAMPLACQLLPRYCCKSRFALVVGDSAGRRCDFRVKMWGASSPHVKLTGDLANVSEAIRIGDCFPFCNFAKNQSPCNFRLLQQYRPDNDCASDLPRGREVPKVTKTRRSTLRVEQSLELTLRGPVRRNRPGFFRSRALRRTIVRSIRSAH
jgi:hypothetical protein